MIDQARLEQAAAILEAAGVKVRAAAGRAEAADIEQLAAAQELRDAVDEHEEAQRALLEVIAGKATQ